MLTKIGTKAANSGVRANTNKSLPVGVVDILDLSAANYVGYFF